MQFKKTVIFFLTIRLDKINLIKIFNLDIIHALFFLFLIFSSLAFTNTKILPNGITLESTFTPKGKLQKVISSDGSIDHTFEYDEHDGLISGSTLDTHFERIYNTNGDLLEEKWNTGLSCRKKYDEAHRPIAILLPEGKTIQISYNHDSLTSISYGSYLHIFNAYDLQGRLLEESLPFDLGIIKRDYNIEGFPTSLTAPFLTQEITYDIKNRPIEITTNGKKISYSYDEANQLSSEDGITYAFDGHYHPIQVGRVSAEVNEQGHRTFINSETGDKVRFDEGKPEEPGFKGEDHWHRYNPDQKNGKMDQYLDKEGYPTPKNSLPSHLFPGD